jgi:hypothetical protein
MVKFDKNMVGLVKSELKPKKLSWIIIIDGSFLAKTWWNLAKSCCDIVARTCSVLDKHERRNLTDFLQPFQKL